MDMILLVIELRSSIVRALHDRDLVARGPDV
ncbi:hypothetical protein VAB18032_26405 [Micromonospora maris AB-18-032]|nr:hypothetical protein VAB18032_26405 [Micromonospora maris AB-18-032]